MGTGASSSVGSDEDRGVDCFPCCKNKVIQADQSIQPTYHDSINIKSPTDYKNCLIMGMAMLPPDKLVLVDCLNNCVKLVDVNSQSFIYKLPLGSATYQDMPFVDTPWDVTSTKSTQVAVTRPFFQCIQFISVSHELSTSHTTIQTNGECYGICYHQEKLVVTFWSPKKIEILDMEGKVLRRMGPLQVAWPELVQVSSSSIYVSDKEFDKVIMMSWSGDITGEIACIKTPEGMALLEDGSLLVCDTNDGKVYLVSSVNSPKVVIPFATRPRAICVDEAGQKLFISKSSASNELANSILVYNI